MSPKRLPSRIIAVPSSTSSRTLALSNPAAAPEESEDSDEGLRGKGCKGGSRSSRLPFKFLGDLWKKLKTTTFKRSKSSASTSSKDSQIEVSRGSTQSTIGPRGSKASKLQKKTSGSTSRLSKFNGTDSGGPTKSSSRASKLKTKAESSKKTESNKKKSKKSKKVDRPKSREKNPKKTKELKKAKKSKKGKSYRKSIKRSLADLQKLRSLVNDRIDVETFRVPLRLEATGPSGELVPVNFRVGVQVTEGNKVESSGGFSGFKFSFDRCATVSDSDASSSLSVFHITSRHGAHSLVNLLNAFQNWRKERNGPGPGTESVDVSLKMLLEKRYNNNTISSIEHILGAAENTKEFADLNTINVDLGGTSGEENGEENPGESSDSDSDSSSSEADSDADSAADPGEELEAGPASDSDADSLRDFAELPSTNFDASAPVLTFDESGLLESIVRSSQSQSQSGSIEVAVYALPPTELQQQTLSNSFFDSWLSSEGWKLDDIELPTLSDTTMRARSGVHESGGAFRLTILDIVERVGYDVLMRR